MSLIARIGPSCVALALLFLVPDVAAAPKHISGKLSKPGYTVIALAGDRQAEAVRANGRRFRLRPPATRVSLHLRAPDGVYAGPVVLGSRRGGTRAILGVRAGARLGSILVRRGYATVSKRRAGRFRDATRVARARRGVPIGAAVFGRVRSQPPRRPPPGDLDLDGVPGSLDIDDDGDLVLDDVDGSPAPGPPRAAQQEIDSPFLSFVLELTGTETVNVNPRDPLGERVFSDQEIEEIPLTSTLAGGIVSDRSPALRIGFQPGLTTELDCGKDNPDTTEREGLIYCSSGTPPSRGRIFPNGPTEPPEVFPDCCDSDGDGFGELRPVSRTLGGVMELHFTGTTADFKTGQVLIKEHVSSGLASLCPDQSNLDCVTFRTVLPYVSATVPALVSYSDTAGNAGSLQYPIATRRPFSSPRLVAPDANGDVKVTVILWQPQRRPTSEAECAQPRPSCTTDEWIDIGGLTYSSTVTTGPHVAPFQSRRCPQDAYAIPPGQDPSTWPFTAAPPSGLDADRGLKHTLPDRPANPDNTVTYQLNLTKCLGGLPWGPGQSTSVEFRASGEPQGPGIEAGHASQTSVSFQQRGGRITVRKETDPPEPAGGTEFEFGSDIPPDPNFKLRHGGATTFEVPPGTYRVDEALLPDYEIAVSCDDDDSTASPPQSVTVRVELNEHVTCTFNNTKKP